MSRKQGRGRPPSNPTSPPRTTNEFNSSLQNNYKNFSENVGGDGFGNGAKTKGKS